ncbi:MAG: PilN domain-containing protein [Phycisphaerae bacterium]|nr:PilN domain-containing protein [Phycisphaerae bacterium]
MIGVNLIPAELLIARAVRRRIRVWLVVSVVLVGVVLVPIVVEGHRQGQVQRLRLKIAGMETRLHGVRGKVANVAQTVLDTDLELARSEALRTKRCWSGLLGLVADCMPQEVWLTSIATDPPQPGSSSHELPRAARRRSARETGKQQDISKPAEVVILQAPTKIRLEGFALDHGAMMDLITRLKASRAFTAVEQVTSGREPVLQGDAVRFVVTCQW